MDRRRTSGLTEILLGITGLAMVVGILSAQTTVDRQLDEAMTMTMMQDAR